MPPINSRQPRRDDRCFGRPRNFVQDRQWTASMSHPAVLKMALSAKGADRFFLVTDAMPPVGTDATGFELYGQRILRRDGRLVTEDGTLAGADIDMASAVRNCVHMLGLPLEKALVMASLHPAEFLRLDDRFGRSRPRLPGGSPNTRPGSGGAENLGRR